MTAPASPALGRPDTSAMNLRLVDSDLQLDQAFDLVERTLKAWSGGRTDDWRRDGPEGVREEGATYARRDDVYVAVSMTDTRAVIGVALMPGDRTVLEITLPRRGPARDRRRAALAVDDNGETFLLIADEVLRQQGVRDAFRRMAGHGFAKRARVGGRDYLMLGPLSDTGAVDALLALAALHPAFEAHLDTLARLDAPAPSGLYRVSDALARQHRLRDKVAFAAGERLMAAGFALVDCAAGPYAADTAARRGDVAAALVVAATASPTAVSEVLGALALVAPHGWSRLVALPAPRDANDPALALALDGCAALSALSLVYDLRDGEVSFTIAHAPASTPAAVLAAWDED